MITGPGGPVKRYSLMSYLHRLVYLLLFISLTACGDNQPPEPETARAEKPVELSRVEPAIEPDTPPTEPLNPVAPLEGEDRQERYIFEETWTGDLDALEDRRVIRLLTVYSVGRYYMDNGEEKGLVKETARMLERFINKQLKRKNVIVHVVVIPVARNQLIPALLEGRGDVVVASLSITPERQEIVDFTIPSTKPLSEILVTGPGAPELGSIEDLSGQTIFVRRTSSYRESVDELNETLAAAGKPPAIIEPASELLEDDDLVELVNNGTLPWAIVDDYKLQMWKDVFDQVNPRHDIVFRSGGRIAWAIRPDSPKLEAALNGFLKKNREGTLVGNVLKNRWVRDFDWAENALAKDEYKRFKDLEHIFQKYGDQYGVEYLLAAAQGYQESRLDQSARSHTGAVGVMQLLPSTAKDRNVDIANIHEVDGNIHAGIKYLDYLRERYFSDPEIDDLNKTLLALATYNAGPRRMINMRNEAEKLGYNPNVWFDNVEMVAAKRIGRETVQYVANIYKYYLAYRLSLDQVLLHQEAREQVGIR